MDFSLEYKIELVKPGSAFGNITMQVHTHGL
ncbi:hypothetical protein EV144_103402 [Flavobacterium sp. 270]|nr:hypothetical protein EV144_103402 [Flavobacterium sp. 270]